MRNRFSSRHSSSSRASSRRPVSRRTFLGSVGAAACLAPFVPLLQSEAAEDGPPRRLVLLFSPNGTLHENWAPDGSESDFQLSPILAPLAAFTDSLVVLDGLEVLNPGNGDNHQKGMGLLWTASPLQSGTAGNGTTGLWSTGISVDQAVADAIGGSTAFQSLEFGVQTGGASVFSRMSYAGPNQPVAPEDNPWAMFERIFGDFDDDSGALEKIKLERRSVIDAVKGDLERISARFGAEDKVKVEAHLDAIRQIEQRNELATPACEVPSLGAPGDHQSNGTFPATSRLQIDELVMALACDLTRVASLQWSKAVSNQRFEWLGIGEGHHDLSHLGNGDASMVQKITAINTWYAGEVAYLLQKLSEVPEGDGTMLDNTLVVWGNELSRGNTHGNYAVPFVLAGGAGGAIDTGRYLTYDRAPHNRMLVSICRAMGLDDTQTFGVTDPGSGGLPGLV